MNVCEALASLFASFMRSMKSCENPLHLRGVAKMIVRVTI